MLGRRCHLYWFHCYDFYVVTDREDFDLWLSLVKKLKLWPVAVEIKFCARALSEHPKIFGRGVHRFALSNGLWRWLLLLSRRLRISAGQHDSTSYEVWWYGTTMTSRIFEAYSKIWQPATKTWGWSRLFARLLVVYRSGVDTVIIIVKIFSR